MNRARSFTLFSFITGLLMLSAMFVPVSISQNPTNEVNGTPVGWSDEVNLSNDPAYRDNLPEMAIYENCIHVVWLHNYQDIYYSKSVDEGESWSTPINLFHSILSSDRPYIGVSGNDVHIVWSYWNDTSGLHEILYCNSSDNGDTWDTPRLIFNTTSYNVYACGIYVNHSNVHIISFDFRDGTNGEIYYRRSLDGGINFDNGQGIDEDRRITFGLTIKGGITIAGEGSNISLTWSDERDGDWEVYWMISKDNGYTWEDGLGTPHVGRRLTDDTSDAMDLTIGVNGSNIHIVWADQSWPGPEYHLYYRNSTDNGATWNTQKYLTGPYSTYPNIDVKDEIIYIVWNDEREDGEHEEIYLKNSTDGGITWSEDLRLTYNLTTRSFHPKINIENGVIHIVWDETFPSTDREIYYKRYPDFSDLSPPSHTNETPPPDSYRDAPGTNVSVHVTDPSGVNESTIQLWVNGSLVLHTSTPITDGFNVSYISPGFDPGVVECRIVADDNLSNHLDYTWNFTVLATYDIILDEGWNSISVPLEQVDTSIDEVLKDIAGKWDYILIYDTITGTWLSNSTHKPPQLNDFDTLDHKVGFWINITEPGVTLTVRGNISSSTSIPLFAGWNLVGYPTLNDTVTIGVALFGTGADMAMVCDTSEPYHIKEVGPTYVMKPGEGYWVHVVADSVWIVDW